MHCTLTCKKSTKPKTNVQEYVRNILVFICKIKGKAIHSEIMSTFIKEECLDFNNQPNDNAKLVQAEFDKCGCPYIFNSGKKKGQQCGGHLRFKPAHVRCFCHNNKEHNDWAYNEPFNSTVFGVLNAACKEREKEEQVKRIEANIKDAHCKAMWEAVHQGKISKDFVASLIEMGNLMEIGHVRPDGKAPENQTWSYLDGAWESTCLGKRKRSEETAETADESANESVVESVVESVNELNVSCQVDVKTPPKSRVRIMSGNYACGNNGSNGKGELVRTTPCRAIVLLEGTAKEVQLKFASLELDFGSADNCALPSGETKTTDKKEMSKKGRKVEPRPSSPEELAYFTKWNDAYGKKLNEAEHNEKEYPQTNNVNKTGFHLRQSFIFKGHENSFKIWYQRELKSKGVSWKTLPRPQTRGLMGRWGVFMETLYMLHNYSGQNYFLYFEFQ